MPTVGWRLSGNGRLLKYNGRHASGPVVRALIKDGRLLRVIVAAIPFPLNRPEGRIAVSFRSGSRRYCALFEGSAVRRDVPCRFVGRFVGRRAPAPASCPE